MTGGCGLSDFDLRALAGLEEEPVDVTALKKGSGEPAHCYGMGTYLVDIMGYFYIGKTESSYGERWAQHISRP